VSFIRSAFPSVIHSRLAVAGFISLTLSACAGQGPAVQVDPSGPTAAGGTMLAGSAALLGRWEKVERSMPPIALELRADAADRVTGRVWLSGVTYEAPVALDESSFVLGADSKPTMRGVLVADGRLRVELLAANGSVEHEATLVRVQ
jgi:hypothetical protein